MRYRRALISVSFCCLILLTFTIVLNILFYFISIRMEIWTPPIIFNAMPINTGNVIKLAVIPSKMSVWSSRMRVKLERLHSKTGPFAFHVNRITPRTHRHRSTPSNAKRNKLIWFPFPIFQFVCVCAFRSHYSCFNGDQIELNWLVCLCLMYYNELINGCISFYRSFFNSSSSSSIYRWFRVY